MSRSQEVVQERYRRALDALTQKLQQDRTVLAAIVYGSYSYDQVWEKSDIDLWIVMADDPKVRRYEDHCLTEEGVIIHANLIPRKRFQLNIEGSRPKAVGSTLLLPTAPSYSPRTSPLPRGTKTPSASAHATATTSY